MEAISTSIGVFFALSRAAQRDWWSGTCSFWRHWCCFLSHYYGGNFYLNGDQNGLYFVITTLLFYTFLLISGVLLLLVWRYASRKQRLIDEDLSPAVVRNTTLRLLRVPFAIIIFLVTFVVFDGSIVGSVLPMIAFLLI